jgi:selenocysteine lyase/cysteine desulfurase
MTQRLIYLDNASTTLPKPENVLSDMVAAYQRMGVSPGRGSYDLAFEAMVAINRSRKSQV